MEKITLPQVRDLGQTIGDSFLFARANFKFLVRFFLFYAVPPLLVAVALFVFGYKKTDSGFGVTPGYNMFAHLNGLGMLGYLLYLFTILFQQLYITEYLILKETFEDVTLTQTLAQIREDSGTIIITLLLLFALTIPVIGIVVFIVFIANSIGGYMPAICGIPLAVLLIYSLIPLSSIFFVRLREKLGMADALVKCFQIIKGNWWRTFVAWFVGFLVYYAFLVSLLAPVSLLLLVFRFHAVTPLQTDVFGMAILGVAGTLAGFMYFFSLNIFQVFIGVNYFSLSEKYDGYHLKSEINEIGVRDDRNVHRQEGEY